jgi:signal peptidase I
VAKMVDADSPEPSPENAGSHAPDTDSGAAPAEASTPNKRKQGVLRKVTIVVAILVVLLVVGWGCILTFVVQPYLTPSESMAPTLQVGDRIIVDKLTYRSGSPKPGDVIVFNGLPNWNIGYKSIRSTNPAIRWMQNALSFIGLVPPDENQLVKRVIAVGGQTVECRVATGLTVDGMPLDEPYLDPATMEADPKIYPCLGNEFGPVKVPDGRLWVMGDNRTHSADSRAHCGNTATDAQRGLLCTGDPTPGTVPVDNVIGKVRLVTSR